MKLKLENGPKGTGRILHLKADKDDELTYVDAERVHRGDLSCFLPFTYRHDGKTLRFVYHPGSCPTVEQLVKSPLTPMHLRMALGSLLAMMQACEANSLSRLRVMLDPAYVFFDAATAGLRFAYVPLRSFASQQSEADLIARICGASMADASDQQFAVAMWDFVQRTTILTSVALQDFLQSWGLQASPAPATSREPTRAPHANLTASDSLVLVRLATGKHYQLGRGAFVIGRSAECAICIPDSRGLSRKHASIAVDGTTCTLRDLGSTNGIFVNGERLLSGSEGRLAPGARFSLGQEEFQLLERRRTQQN